jgi:hypothetical protein
VNARSTARSTWDGVTERSSYAHRPVFEFPNEDIAKYHKVFEARGEAVLDQPQRLGHTCYSTDEGFTVIDAWADEASFAAFGEVIGPALQSAGLNAVPAVYALVGTITQDGSRSTY